MKTIIKNIENLYYRYIHDQEFKQNVLTAFIILSFAILIVTMSIYFITSGETYDEVLENYVIGDKGSEITYSGEHIEGVPNGYGRMVVENIDNNIDNIIMQGIFVDGEFIEGKIIVGDKNKDISFSIDGTFKEGVLSYGDIAYRDGDYLVFRGGSFVDNKLDGQGKKTLSSNVETFENFQGTFKEEIPITSEE